VEAPATGLPCVFSDRFTREAIVDPKLVTVLTLSDSAGRWVAALLDTKGKRIRNTVTHLQEFYATEFNLARCVQSLSNTYVALVAKRRGRQRSEKHTE
jgi:hypothetical protein